MRVRNVRWVVIAIIVVLVLIGKSGSELQGQTATSWTEQDIGNPAIAGSATSSTSGFTIAAGGTDIGGYSDQFRFVYQPVTGDVDVRARVDSLTYTLAGAKAGVMIRGSLTPGAAHGFALVSAGSTAFDRRTQPDGSSAHTAGALVAAPQWVRLVRQGSIVSAYTSTDGAGWSADRQRYDPASHRGVRRPRSDQPGRLGGHHGVCLADRRAASGAARGTAELRCRVARDRRHRDLRQRGVPDSTPAAPTSGAPRTSSITSISP